MVLGAHKQEVTHLQLSTIFEIDSPGNAVDFGDIQSRYGSYTSAGG